MTLTMPPEFSSIFQIVATTTSEVMTGTKYAVRKKARNFSLLFSKSAEAIPRMGPMPCPHEHDRVADGLEEDRVGEQLLVISQTHPAGRRQAIEVRETPVGGQSH